MKYRLVWTNRQFGTSDTDPAFSDYPRSCSFESANENLARQHARELRDRLIEKPECGSNSNFKLLKIVVEEVVREVAL
jgi:hypothetical protein